MFIFDVVVITYILNRNNTAKDIISVVLDIEDDGVEDWYDP